MGKKYFELHYNAHLSVSGIPMMEVDSVPVLRQLHDEINSVMENHEYFDEVVSSLKDVLDGHTNWYEFGYEVYYFECDKDDCEVFEWDKKIGLLRTIDMYEMLRYFQHYRDDYYSRMNS